MSIMREFMASGDKMSFIRKQTESLDSLRTSWKILIVDDDEDIHEVTVMALKRVMFESVKLELLSAYSAAEAIEVLLANPDIVVALLDVVMENDAAGLDLVRHIRYEMGNSDIRILLRTGNPGLAPEDSVTQDYDINDYRGKTELTALSLRTMIITALRSYKAISTIRRLNHEIDNTQRELIYTLGEIAEFRSTDTGHHIRTVGEISGLMGRKIGLSIEQAEMLNLAASMHDLGKIAIDETILNKPGKLTIDEFEIIKTHSVLGHEIFRKSRRPLLQMASIITKEHHENYDGSGYPLGLKGEEINLMSRIVALVDVFDALGNKRVYKNAWTEEKIFDFIRAESGKKFDPFLVDLFFESLDEIREIVRNTALPNPEAYAQPGD